MLIREREDPDLQTRSSGHLAQRGGVSELIPHTVELGHVEFGPMVRKNVFEIVDVCLAAAVSMTGLHVLVGVGIGSVLCMLGVGRVIAAVNRLVR